MIFIVPFLRQVIIVGLGVVLLVPFVYTDSTTFPFVFGKVVVLRIIVEVLFACFIALLLLDPTSRIRKNRVLLALAALAAALALSVAFGFDPHKSFWGNHERMSGFYSVLHALLLAPIAASALRSSREWERYWLWGLVTANVMAAIGLVQYFSKNNFLLTSGGGRIWATLGNYIYLGQYSLFFSILAGGLALLADRRWMRFFAFGTAILQFIILLLTETRGALLGFAAALVFLFGWFWFRRDVIPGIARRSRGIVAAGVLGILIAFFFFGHQLPFTKHIPGFRRLTFHGFTEVVGGTSTRLIAWNIALQAWQARPVFGWGVDNFNYAFNRFYNPRSLKFSFYETWFDRAHNSHLDTVAMTGAVGALATLFLYYTVIRVLVRRAALDRRAAIRSGFALAIFIAYLVQLTFVFDSATSLSLIALFYGWVARFEEGDAPPLPASPPRGVTGKMLVIAPVALLALLAVFYTNLQPWRANHLDLVSAAEIQVNGNLAAGLAAYAQSRAIATPHRRDINLDFARDVSGSFGSSAAAANPDVFRMAWQVAVAALEENIAAYHNDAYEYLLQGQLLQIGSAYDPEALSRAEDRLEQGIALSPKRQQFYFSLAKIKLLRGNKEEAVTLLRKAVAFDDTVGESHWYLAIALSDTDNRQEAFDHIKQALAFGYTWHTPVEILFSADLAREMKDAERQYAYLLMAESAYASVPEYQARLAEAASAAGEPAVARAAAERAVAGDGTLRARLQRLFAAP